MKVIGKYSISNFMNILLLVIMVFTLILLFTLPYALDWYIGLNPHHQVKNILLITLYPIGICGFFVENELRKIFKSLVNKDPFVEANVKSLRTMAYVMIGVVLALVYKMIMLFTIMTFVVFFASLILIVFCFVLADVFKQAVLYKQDIDLTV